jgi:hypothetical protein
MSHWCPLAGNRCERVSPIALMEHLGVRFVKPFLIAILSIRICVNYMRRSQKLLRERAGRDTPDGFEILKRANSVGTSGPVRQFPCSSQLSCYRDDMSIAVPSDP